MGSGAAFALTQLDQHKKALAREREKVAALEARIKRLEAAEDAFVCPKCGASVKRLEIPLHQAHEQHPPWNTGFEWCGSCPSCDVARSALTEGEGEELHSIPPMHPRQDHNGDGPCLACEPTLSEDDERELAGLCEGCGAKVHEGDERYLGEVFLCQSCEENKGLP